MKYQEKLNALVAELLATHGGGEGYFSTLDARLQLRENLDIVKALFSGLDGDLVVTGSFGHYLRDLRRFHLIPGLHLLHFSGGLRHGDLPRVLFSSRQRQVREYTFVDDSYYSGKTYRAIARMLTAMGSSARRIRVVYDGSVERDRNISSLYRYYDRHKPVVARGLPIH